MLYTDNHFLIYNYDADFSLLWLYVKLIFSSRDENRKVVKTRATCYKEGVETVIAQKACSCDPRTITDSLTLILQMPYLNMIFCKDIITGQI